MDLWFWFFVVATVFVGVCASGWWAFQAYRDGRFARGRRWLRVLSLGGATTLKRDLNDSCTLCRYGMVAGEKVRTLSCNHVFHRGGISKCENGIDKWLRTVPRMICPNCRKTPHAVLPWKAPPPSLLAPAPPSPLRPPLAPQSSSGSDDIEIPPPQSSSGLENTSPPDSSSGLDDPLLPPSQ
ncbi:hypothetical protein BS78_02G337600 [Paspalum vaginatum]|nr:hypothetical protein BS78_02G337600 [Paspalum vaginatum]